MSSYFVAFSNDSRDWTTLHDGYAEWVRGDSTKHKLLILQFIDYKCTFLFCVILSCSCSMGMWIRTHQCWASLLRQWWRATSASCLRAGTEACVLELRSWPVNSPVSITTALLPGVHLFHCFKQFHRFLSFMTSWVKEFFSFLTQICHPPLEEKKHNFFQIWS